MIFMDGAGVGERTEYTYKHTIILNKGR